ncbi:MAG: hypothetical protein EBX49_08750 [Synechococcaceae bacterium WB8_1B_136]|nr:hypothetical protein [Synechococcaceae bacterium WB8_1B_136]
MRRPCRRRLRDAAARGNWSARQRGRRRRLVPMRGEVRRRDEPARRRASRRTRPPPEAACRSHRRARPHRSGRSAGRPVSARHRAPRQDCQ